METEGMKFLMKRVNLAQDFSQMYAKNGKNQQKLQGMPV
jgi:hypothetical protein